MVRVPVPVPVPIAVPVLEGGGEYEETRMQRAGAGAGADGDDGGDGDGSGGGDGGRTSSAQTRETTKPQEPAESARIQQPSISARGSGLAAMQLPDADAGDSSGASSGGSRGASTGLRFGGRRLCLSVNTSHAASDAKLEHVEPKELPKLLLPAAASDRNIKIVDVRTDEERADGYIAGSVHMPYSYWQE